MQRSILFFFIISKNIQYIYTLMPTNSDDQPMINFGVVIKHLDSLFLNLLVKLYWNDKQQTTITSCSFCIWAKYVHWKLFLELYRPKILQNHCTIFLCGNCIGIATSTSEDKYTTVGVLRILNDLDDLDDQASHPIADIIMTINNTTNNNAFVVHQ